MASVIMTGAQTSAEECRYGTLDAWVRQGTGEWENATVHTNLKINEPVDIKATMTTKVDCDLFAIQLYCYSRAYEISSGPGEMNEWWFDYDFPTGSQETFEWTIEPTGKFVEGQAPLNIRAQFSTPADNEFIDFTIIAAYIENEEGQGGNGDDENGDGDGNGDGIPGFNGPMLTLSLAVVLSALYVAKRKRK